VSVVVECYVDGASRGAMIASKYMMAAVY